MKISKSYIIEHLKKSLPNDDELMLEVRCDNRYPDLVRVQFQSRHSKSAEYNATVRFNFLAEQAIEEWFCTCQTGPRQLGCCAHIAALLWHLGVIGAKIPEAHPLSLSDTCSTTSKTVLYIVRPINSKKMTMLFYTQ